MGTDVAILTGFFVDLVTNDVIAVECSLEVIDCGSLSAFLEGNRIPRPPNLAGRVNNRSFGGSRVGCAELALHYLIRTTLYLSIAHGILDLKCRE